MTGILQNQESGVLTLTLNRVDKKNSLNASMYAALADALQMATENAEVKVVLVQGHETVFSAGNDIADFLQQPPATEASAVFRFLKGIAVFPKPLLASVCVDPRWVWAPPCCSIATWCMRVTTPRFPCPL
jgi:enoyl-CoA hydratase/carnithine racemase